MATVVVAAEAIHEASSSADTTFSDAPPSCVQGCSGTSSPTGEGTDTPVQPPPESAPAPEETPDEGEPKGPEPNPPKKPPPIIPYIPHWTPDDDSQTHPDHYDVDRALEEDSDDCSKIGWAIDVLVRSLKFRRWDMQRPGRGGGDKGHRDRYYKEQKELRRLVDKADRLGCPYNDQANTEKNRPHNFPTPRY